MCVDGSVIHWCQGVALALHHRVHSALYLSKVVDLCYPLCHNNALPSERSGVE
jgi:hypothetical protein